MPHCRRPVHRQPRSARRAIGALCRTLAEILVAQRDGAGARVFPIGGIARARLSRRRISCVADGAPIAPSCYAQRAQSPRAARARRRRAAGEALFAAVRVALRRRSSRAAPVGIIAADRRRQRGRFDAQAQQPARRCFAGRLTDARRRDHRRARAPSSTTREKTRACRCATSRAAIRGMTIDDGYAIQRAWVRSSSPTGASSRAARSASPRARCSSRRRSTSPTTRRCSTTCSSLHGGDIPFDRFIAPRVEVELAFVLGKPLQGPGRDARRRARRDRPRDPGARDHRCAHRAVRPRDQGAAQGLRHDLRLRRQRRHRRSAAGRCGPTRVDLRWVGAMLYKNGVDRGDRPGRRRARPPGQRRRLARQQDRAVRRAADAGDVVLARLVHAADRRRRGDAFHVDYGPLGAIAFRFA